MLDSTLVAPGSNEVTIIGGGLGGSEAAWQLAESGIRVRLFEMRPQQPTLAHKTDRLGELVCSNSLKSDEPTTAPYLLKQELRLAGSLLIQIAEACKVPAGSALAVDRERFAGGVTDAILGHPNIMVEREEIRRIPGDGDVVIATGPLTSPALAEQIQGLTGADRLYFYDAISPIVDAGSIDHRVVFRAARYGKGGDDYLNCPMTRDEYQRFYDALMTAEKVELHEFDNVRYFEGCLPLEEMARRGRDTLLFGPLKPVGLVDPRTRERPYAVVQLRQENLMADSFNMVGFQTQLKWGEQKRIFRLIPGLERAEFFRMGQIHRNTYINSPACLGDTLELRAAPRVRFAGQLCGVEGYVESLATGLLAALFIIQGRRGDRPVSPPRESACGSLIHFITHGNPENFQPANINFALLPPLDSGLNAKLRNKKERHETQIEIALSSFREWLRKSGFPETGRLRRATVVG